MVPDPVINRVIITPKNLPYERTTGVITLLIGVISPFNLSLIGAHLFSLFVGSGPTRMTWTKPTISCFKTDDSKGNPVLKDDSLKVNLIGHPFFRNSSQHMVWFIYLHNWVKLRGFYQLIHPVRLTWNLQITLLERNMIFQTSMSMFYVYLQGCIYIECLGMGLLFIQQFGFHHIYNS